MDKYSTYADGNLVLELGDYSYVQTCVKIINTHTIPNKVVVKVPKLLSSNYVLYEVKQILPDTGEVDFSFCIEKKSGHPWMDIIPEFFDWTIGQHMYKFSFVNIYTNETCSAYLTYRSQQDNPERPYAYMDKYRKSEVVK